MDNFKGLELGMFDGAKVYVPASALKELGVFIPVDSFIGNYLRGSRGPLLTVYPDSTFAEGTGYFINPAFIVSVKRITA